MLTLVASVLKLEVNYFLVYLQIQNEALNFFFHSESNLRFLNHQISRT